ncbi:unnamed protein product [Linum trigynum]|uniref:Reverse transcriptase zinc-binding domain-containing protein n=1 Tax=Linum trigynum TaxID=586398 RepID=A0AAV2GBH9_9ROSI
MDRYKVKLIWEHFRHKEEDKPWFKLIWQPILIAKNSLISWLITLNRISTFDKIQKWQPEIVNRCPLCLGHEESRDHLFFACSFVQEVIEAVFPPSWGYLPRGGWGAGLQEAVIKLQDCCVGRVLWNATISAIWRERCSRVYGKKIVEAEDLIANLKQIMEAMMLGNLKFSLAVEKRKLWFM